MRIVSYILVLALAVTVIASWAQSWNWPRKLGPAVSLSVQGDAESIRATGFYDFGRFSNRASRFNIGDRSIRNGSPLTDWNSDSWQDAAMLLQKGQRATWCTGVLIAPKAVLTAAHCLCDEHGQKVGVSQVAFGTSMSDRDRKQVVEVEQGTEKTLARSCTDFAQPPYLSDSSQDLAVIFLRQTAVVSSRKIIAHSPAALKAGESATIVGFGEDQFGVEGKRTTSLKVSSVDCRFGRDCHENWEMILEEADRGICHGDSGGPAYVKIGNEMVVAGIASRAAQLCNGTGNIYVRLNDKADEWLGSMPELREARFSSLENSRSICAGYPFGAGPGCY